MHTNISSIIPKFSEFQLYIINNNPDIILISESWLNNNIPDSVVDIPNFAIYRSDREDRRGGGVCIYVKISSNNPCIVVERFLPSNISISGIEHLWLKVCFNCCEFILACIYRPPTSTFEEDIKLFNVIANEGCKSCPTLIFGDFNFPTINWKFLSPVGLSGSAAEFLDCIANSGLNQLVDFPTRFRGCNRPSTLDLVFSNSHNFLSSILSDSPIGLSDHIIINSLIQWCDRSQCKPQTDPFLKQLEINIHSKWDSFYHIINAGIQKFVPFLKPFKSKCKPWINKPILILIKEKRKLRNTYAKHKTHEVSTIMNEKKELITDPLLIANTFAKAFSNSFIKEDSTNLPLLPNLSRNSTEINNIMFSEKVVSEVLHNLGDNSAPGRSVLSNLLTVHNDWSLLLNNNIPVDVVYLDFEKAFDRVPIDRLLLKIEHIGLDPALQNLIPSLVVFPKALF
ncbi:uncharacterized protein LOC143917906 [Arctopsyche grandis]|uniref:uncharacterized protein LOC143917906 n=1 Tax=Arctopsyche grandis TaxID=121162 RepID=UPI00406D76C7